MEEIVVSSSSFPSLQHNTSPKSETMTGTLAETRLQLQNAESSILFMQQEHAQTLQGLYAEISKLQKKCGEMTFKLAMNATSSTTDEAQLEKEVSEAREAVKLLRAENVELKAIIDTGYKRIVVLENQVKGFEQKYNRDIKERDTRIGYLTKELNTKSDTIAYLTNQLHQMKLKEASKKHDQASRGSRRNQRKEESSSVGEATVSYNTASNSEAVPSACAPPTPPITPSPPSQGAPTRVRRPIRRSATSPTPAEFSVQKSKSQRAIGIQASPHEIHLNVSSAKTNKGLPSRPKRGASPPRPGIGIAKNPSRSGGKERPPTEEYVEFLRSGVRPEPQVVVRAAPEPLPPISANDMHLKRTPSYHGISRGSSQKVQDDVGKIVVSPLGSPEKGWRHKEQSPQSNGPKM